MARNQQKSMTVEDDLHDTDEDAQEEEQEITKDDLFHVLQNERRRRVLAYLVSNGDGPFEMRTIAEHVAAEEHGTTVQALTSDQRQRVYIALYQSHLPKLAKKGFIDYQQSRGVVEKRPLVEETVEHLSEVEEDEEDDGSLAPDHDSTASPSPRTADTRLSDRWQRSFVGAIGVGGVLVSSAWTNVLPSISGVTVAAVVFALFAAMSAGVVLDSE